MKRVRAYKTTPMIVTTTKYGVRWRRRGIVAQAFLSRKHAFARDLPVLGLHCALHSFLSWAAINLGLHGSKIPGRDRIPVPVRDGAYTVWEVGPKADE
jgi:hypothetical protein